MCKARLWTIAILAIDPQTVVEQFIKVTEYLILEDMKIINKIINSMSCQHLTNLAVSDHITTHTLLD